MDRNILLSIFVWAACACSALGVTSTPTDPTPDPNATPNPAYPKKIGSTAHLDVYQVGDHSYATRAKPGEFDAVGGNAGIIVTAQGVVVVDTFMTTMVANELQTYIADELSDLPILYAVNTHFHDDHTWGNSAFGDETQIIAHQNSASHLSFSSRAADIAIGEDYVLFDGGSKVIVKAYGKGHSVGDVMVYFPLDRVVWGGDMYVRRYVGYMSEGWFEEWVLAMDDVREQPVWVAVPGHGGITKVEGLAEHRNYIFEFARTAKDHFEAGGMPSTYTLPEAYDHYGSDYFLEGNVQRAYSLWQTGELDWF